MKADEHRTEVVAVAVSLLAVVLACLPARSLGYDRFATPKDLVLAAVACLLSVIAWRRRLAISLLPGELGWLLFLGAGCLSAGLAANGWWALRSLNVAIAAVEVMLLCRSLTAAGQGTRLLAGVLGATALASLTVVLDAASGWPGVSMAGRMPGGTLGSRNFAAYLLIVGAPLAWRWLLLAPAGRRAVTAFLVTVSVTCAVALTRSRGAWLAGALALLTFVIGAGAAWRELPGRWPRLGRVIAAVCAGLLLAGAAPWRLAWKSDTPYRETAANLFNGREGTGRGRLIQYHRTAAMALAHPLLGVGPGNWSIAYPSYAVEDDPSYHPEEAQPVNRLPNNDWLGVAAQWGLPAFAGLLAAGLTCIAALGRLFRQRLLRRRLAGIGGIATVVGAVVGSLFDPIFTRAETVLFAAVELGVLTAWTGRGRLLAAAPGGWLRPMAAAITLVLVAFSGTRLASGLLRDTAELGGLERAWRLDRGNHVLATDIARQHLEQGDCAQAQAYAERALSASPGARAAVNVLADCASNSLQHQLNVPVNLSPDGRQVLYKIKRGDLFELRLRHASDGSDVLIDRSRNTQLALSWRPDGQVLAFLEAEGGNQQFRPWLLDLSRKSRRMLSAPATSSAGLPLRWSPDGSALAYLVLGAESRLCVVRPDEDRFALSEQVDNHATFSWSPDGRTIAVVPAMEPGAMSLLDARTGSVRLTRRLIDGLLGEAVFSGEGSALLFTGRRRGEEFFRLWRVDDAASGKPTAIAEANGDISEPWALPKRQVVFRVNRQEEEQLWIASTAGGRTRALGSADGAVSVRGRSAAGTTLFVHHTGRRSPPVLETLELPTGERRTLLAPFPEDAALAPEPHRILIPTPDGQHVPARFWQTDSPRSDRSALLIMLHGARGRVLAAWDHTVQTATSQGFDVLAIDYRGSRGQGARWEQGGLAEATVDLLAAQEHAVTQLGYAPGQILLWGSSHGAVVALSALARAPAGFMGALLLGTAAAAATVPAARVPLSGRVVAFHGTNDHVSSPEQAFQSLDRVLGAGVPIETYTLADEGHQFHRFRSWKQIHAALDAFSAPSGRPLASRR